MDPSHLKTLVVVVVKPGGADVNLNNVPGWSLFIALSNALPAHGFMACNCGAMNQ